MRCWAGTRSRSWGSARLTRPADLEAHLVDRGAELCETLAVLALDLTPAPPDLDVPADVEVREVADLETLRDYDRIDMEVFGGTPAHRGASWPRRSPRSPRAAGDPMLVAYRDGERGRDRRLHRGRRRAAAVGRRRRPRGARPGVYRALLDHRLRAGRALGCRMALVKGRVETSAPILRRAGFAAYGEERAYRVTVA